MPNRRDAGLGWGDRDWGERDAAAQARAYGRKKGSPESSRHDAEDFGDYERARRYREWRDRWEAEREAPSEYYGYRRTGYRGYGVADVYGAPWRGERPGPYFGRGPRGYTRSDERVRDDINDELAFHPDLDASEMEVRVANGIVTLSGVVEDRGAKRLAEDIAESVLGVEDVNNDLKVRHGLWARVTGEHVTERDVTRPPEQEAVVQPSSNKRRPRRSLGT